MVHKTQWMIAIALISVGLMSTAALAGKPTPQCQPNGEINSGEACDPNGPKFQPGTSCTSLGYASGELKCTRTCQVDASGCLSQCQADLLTCTQSLSSTQGQLSTCKSNLMTCQTAECGNGVAEYGEACDGENLQGATCAAAGLTYGTVRCNADCTLDTSTCTNTRLVDNGDGTVTDNATKLRWEKKTDDGSVHDKDNQYTWSATGSAPDGTAFVNFLGTLNNNTSNFGETVAGCFAGHCDWRLPTLGELATLRDISDKTVLGPLHTSDYWSSTSFAFNQSTAWPVNFFGGLVVGGEKANTLCVIAVRGAP